MIADADHQLLLVEDDERFRSVLARTLAEEFELFEAGTVEEAEKLFDVPIDVAVIDLNLPKSAGRLPDVEEGLELLRTVRAAHPNAQVVVVTSAGTGAAIAVRAMKAGAFDYLLKTGRAAELERLLEACLKAAQTARLKRDNKRYGVQLSRTTETPRQRFEITGESLHCFGIVGESPRIKDLLAQIRDIARHTGDELVLVTGESGTGKELVASAIHYNSSRAERPPVFVNVAALADGVLDSELFGHVKGAFTDARHDRAGFFEAADKSTLVLDEIADLSPMGQAKLLRVLEEKSFPRLGSTMSVKVDVRVVAVTNKTLAELVGSDRFRGDLFQRLTRVTLQLPPLRERMDDVPILVERFLESAAISSQRPVARVQNGVLDALMTYAWSNGNVRELKNFVEPLAMLAPDGLIRTDKVRAELERLKDYTALMRPGGRREQEPSRNTPGQERLPDSEAADAVLASWTGGPGSTPAVERALLRLYITHCGNASRMAEAVETLSRGTVQRLIDRQTVGALARALVASDGRVDDLARTWGVEPEALLAALQWNRRVQRWLGERIAQAGSVDEAASRLGGTAGAVRTILDVLGHA